LVERAYVDERSRQEREIDRNQGGQAAAAFARSRKPGIAIPDDQRSKVTKTVDARGIKIGKLSGPSEVELQGEAMRRNPDTGQLERLDMAPGTRVVANGEKLVFERGDFRFKPIDLGEAVRSGAIPEDALTWAPVSAVEVLQEIFEKPYEASPYLGKLEHALMPDGADDVKVARQAAIARWQRVFSGEEELTPREAVDVRYARSILGIE
jgi:hypothetical protein